VKTVPKLVLASASPARKNLLNHAGIDPEIIVSGVDESAVEAGSAEALCAVLARLKAHAVAERLKHHAHRADLVLGCDSVLAFDGEILGKPDSAEEAVKRWSAMRGRSGVLHTGHCLVDLATGRTAEAVGSTVVYFAAVTDDEIQSYVDSGEPMNVAGAFTIDGRGAPFVERIEGDHGTVVGLSMPLLRRLFQELDRSLIEFWR
jgi:septum formation protein